MLHRYRMIAAVTVTLLLASVPVARATDLSNNLANTTGGVEVATGNRWLTGSFGTDASTHSLSSVTLLLANPIAGTAQLSLYTNGGLEPGTSIATLTAPGSFSGTLAQTTFTASGITLSANTTYWIVLRAVTGEFDWAWTANNAGSGAGFQHTWGVSEDAGAFWWTYDVYPTQFSATVDACTAPLVTGQPSGQTVCPGSSVTLSVTGSGSAPLSFQWRRNATNIGGATGSSYTINPVATGDAGSYDVIVSNSCGSATSNAATLTVWGSCLIGDLNCDGFVNNFDIDPFVLALTNPSGYAAAFPNCNINNADVNSDAQVNNFDIDPFVALTAP